MHSVAKCPLLLCMHRDIDIYYDAQTTQRKDAFLASKGHFSPWHTHRDFSPAKAGLGPQHSLLQTTQEVVWDRVLGILSTFPGPPGARDEAPSLGHLQDPPAICPLPPSPCSEAQEQMQKPRGLKGCGSTAQCRSCHSSHSELQGIRAPCCRVSVQQQSR